MNDATTPDSLEEVLDRMGSPGEEADRVSLGSILDAVGRRSFGPILFAAGLVMVAPVIGDIPGVPTLMGLLIVLTAGQLLFRRDHVWLPEWLLKRSVDEGKLEKTLGWLRPFVRFLDRWSRPRITGLTYDGGAHVVAIACVVIALATPAMEIVPFSANIAGLAITLFGIALVVHDGLVALFALALTAATAGMLIYNWI